MGELRPSNELADELEKIIKPTSQIEEQRTSDSIEKLCYSTTIND